MVQHLTHPPTQVTELATGCLMDFCKGTAVMSPEYHRTPLYSFAYDLAHDLYVRDLLPFIRFRCNY